MFSCIPIISIITFLPILAKFYSFLSSFLSARRTSVTSMGTLCTHMPGLQIRIYIFQFHEASHLMILFWSICSEDSRETLPKWCNGGWNVEKNNCHGGSFPCRTHTSSCMGWACRGARYRSCNHILMYHTWKLIFRLLTFW